MAPPEGGAGGVGRAVDVSLPGRVNLLGNPSDANEGAHQTISVAVELRTRLRVREADERTLAVGGETHALPMTLPGPVEGESSLVIAALNGLVHHSPEASERLAGRGFALALESDVPRGSGLGGSSLVVLSVLAAMRSWLDLDERSHHPYRLAEWAQWAEENEAGTTGGYGDFYPPLFGGLLYMDFRGKLLHRPEGDAPFVTVEQLGQLVPDLPIVVAFSGSEHVSGDVHGPMRKRYLREYSSGQGTLLDLMASVGACAWRGKQAMLRGDWSAVGALFDENDRLVAEMMRRCGVAGEADERNARLMEVARGAGALGAKLAGAGGGGSIVAVTRPGKTGAVEAALAEALEDQGIESGRAFCPRVASDGLQLQVERRKDA